MDQHAGDGGLLAPGLWQTGVDHPIARAARATHARQPDRILPFTPRFSHAGAPVAETPIDGVSESIEKLTRVQQRNFEKQVRARAGRLVWVHTVGKTPAKTCCSRDIKAVSFYQRKPDLSHSGILIPEQPTWLGDAVMSVRGACHQRWPGRMHI